jgi:hypothetical protein
MKIVKDESSTDLSVLLGTLRSVAPDIWGSSQRSLILPQKMEDLERPEFLNGMREKIKALKELKEMLDRGSICREDYSSLRIEILSRI